MEDVETTLTDLEQRLQALQAELDAGAHPSAAAPAAARAPVAAPAPPSPGDPLERFGDDLRRTAADLVAAFDHALAEARGAGERLLFAEDLALEARAGLAGLCALHQALGTVPGVHAVELRAYAGGHAALEVALDRPVALVEELRRTGAVAFGVVEARPGRLAIEVR